MQVKRLAVPALFALSLAACSSDKSTGPSNTTTAQRIAAYEKLTAAGDRADAVGSTDASFGFQLAGIANLFGSGTSSVTVSSNGLANLIAADGQPAFATAGTYQALGLAFRSIDQSVNDTTNAYFILAYKDTTDLIMVSLDSLGTSSFDNFEAFGSIFHTPSAEWWATSGSASLTNMQLGSACTFDSQIQAIIDAHSTPDESYTCNAATFNGAVNIAASEVADFGSGTNTATGSRTASFSRNGLPGLRVTYKYSSTR